MTDQTDGFAALGLNPHVLAAVTELGFEQPTPIQVRAIPEVLAGHDLIGQAQTGTGKTAAFALPILSRLDPALRKPQALILVPTRELALQVTQACKDFSSQLPGLETAAIYGGAPMGPQLRALRLGAQVIVATPGRLCDHLRKNAELLSSVAFLVLDEADEMLKLGFMEDLEAIFQALPEERQSLLFSATLPPSIRGIAEKHLRQPRHVRIAAKTQTVSRIDQGYILVHPKYKTEVVLRLLEVEPFDGVIAFVRTRQATLELAQAVDAKGYKVAALNGDVPQNQRERIVDSLKDGRLDIVVATDVAARGIDVPRISLVLNVDMPFDPESYVHRIGRTGRAGREGRALLLVTPAEQRVLRQIERVTKQPVRQIQLADAQQVLQARIARLGGSLYPLLAEADQQQVLQRLMTELDCDLPTLAGALLLKVSAARPLDLKRIKAEQPPEPTTRSQGPARHGRESGGRKRSLPALSEGWVRCRTSLGARDGIAANNLLGAILNEAGLMRDAIGCISIRDNFSLVELPEKDLDRVLGKLRDTRIAGKALRLRRYREN